MPAPDVALLADAARAAGRIAMGFWQADPEAWEKAAGAGPVTEADLAVDRMLKHELLAARPDYGWLSEETEDEAPARLAAERVFIVDPIDGTRAFIAGEEGFCHALAVAERGRITAAAIYLPVRDELFTATEDGPALLNGAPIRVTGAAAPEGAHALAVRQTFDPAHWQGGRVPALTRGFRAALAWRLCLLAEGRTDAVLSLRRIWEWDLAAGDLIVTRAGGRVTDAAGARVTYNTPGRRAPGLVAAAPLLHARLAGDLAWRAAEGEDPAPGKPAAR
ncbi:3'(2'),5'-bisphosphate nucleotidase CysQ [Frigidibacter sp. MR17.24]|uniref:3'(2'),5'-bisphosphate nucleotidase CysQ n=1 Tax=Frigidibacter sp. MR17.24 TaxID=3127345 RepID=UPI003012E880